MTKQPYTAADRPPKDENLRLLLSSEEGRRIDENRRYYAFACRASFFVLLAGLIFAFGGFGITAIFDDEPPGWFFFLQIIIMLLGFLLVVLAPFAFFEAATGLKKAKERQANYLDFLKRYKRA
ncbi:MAG: hypothetical protein ACPGOV_16560 [Magnetovibrionaceae bacterium]